MMIVADMRKVHGLVYLALLSLYILGGIEELVSIGQDCFHLGRDLNSKHLKYEPGLPAINTTFVRIFAFLCI